MTFGKEIIPLEKNAIRYIINCTAKLIQWFAVVRVVNEWCTSQKSSRDAIPAATTTTGTPDTATATGSGSYASSSGSMSYGAGSGALSYGSGSGSGSGAMLADESWLAGLAMGESGRTCSHSAFFAASATFIIFFLSSRRL